MKKHKKWNLGCGGELRIATCKAFEYFEVTLYRPGSSSFDETRLIIVKYKSTITAIRKMCDWMEKHV